MKADYIDKNESNPGTVNACKLCAPLGASLVFKGIRGAIPLLHGSQGCSTYIRRYLISHYKEPIDIACSNFSEETAVFGGRANLELAIDNVFRQYAPELVGVATTCLSETIGDDVPQFLKEHRERHPDLPPVVHVSTPSYSGTHIDGFHEAVRAVVSALNPLPSISFPTVLPPSRGKDLGKVDCNLFPGMVSPADLRYLKEIMADFGLSATVLPDYSETLDGPLWAEYHKIPDGGTDVNALAAMREASASLEFGQTLSGRKSAGKDLEERHRVSCHSLGLPIGVNETDRLFDALMQISGRTVPDKYAGERGRLIDSYADGHKYVARIRAVVYGEEDLVCGLSAFLDEIGAIPLLCASGGKSGLLLPKISELIPDSEKKGIQVMSGADFTDIAGRARELKPDLLIGNSKGYPIARELGIPLVRVGFPIHDRFGGARLLHLGYRGAQQLFDRIVNAVMATRQETSSVGYAYL